MIGTCKLNGVEPETWLRYVVGRIQDWPGNRVSDLLPWQSRSHLILSVNTVQT
ncbi:transposase domain-containing protein [Serratia bockelmannii]|uniref:transposase domain-containing protein n=1 Tax=Serratia bockelmannii TaxID=2703793 RepID=UPI003F6D1946